MGFIHGANRHEEILFPERLDDYIAAENLVRFIDAFVDRLDLTTLGFQRATPAATGRPAYDPAVSGHRGSTGANLITMKRGAGAAIPDEPPWLVITVSVDLAFRKHRCENTL